MKSKRCLDEIKSVLSPDEVGFHHEVISSIIRWIYPVRKDGFSRAPKEKAIPKGYLFFSLFSLIFSLETAISV